MHTVFICSDSPDNQGKLLFLGEIFKFDNLILSLQDMICAIAELESDRQLLAVRYDKKSKEAKVGLMQITHKNAVWLFGY